MSDDERIDAWRRARGVPTAFADGVMDAVSRVHEGPVEEGVEEGANEGGERSGVGRSTRPGPHALWRHRWLRVAVAVVAVGVGIIRVGMVLSIFIPR